MRCLSSVVNLIAVTTLLLTSIGTVGRPHDNGTEPDLSRSLLWAPAQRKRATMLYFANVFSGPGERRFAKVLHVVDLECH